jgi:subtilisin family serine protease
VRVLDQRGSGQLDDVARGIRYAADNGAHVINLSLSGPLTRAISSAVRHALARGCVIVCAAGNAGRSRPEYPAYLALNFSGVISVGAVDRGSALAGFSNRAGPASRARMRHVVAPGVAVHSTLPDGGHGTASGTSMAAPHVAGVAALMRSASPASTPQRIQEVIIGTASQSVNTAAAGTVRAQIRRSRAVRALAFAAAVTPVPGGPADAAPPARLRFAALVVRA